MAQLNMRVDSAFLQNLDELVQLTGAKSRSEAIREAVDQVLVKKRQEKPFSWRDMVGIAGSLAEGETLQDLEDWLDEGMEF